MAMAFFGACGGPLGGLFFLGGMFPNTNWIVSISYGGVHVHIIKASIKENAHTNITYHHQ